MHFVPCKWYLQSTCMCIYSSCIALTFYWVQLPRFSNSVASLSYNHRGQLLAVASSCTYQEATAMLVITLFFSFCSVNDFSIWLLPANCHWQYRGLWLHFRFVHVVVCTCCREEPPQIFIIRIEDIQQQSACVGSSSRHWYCKRSFQRR